MATPPNVPQDLGGHGSGVVLRDYTAPAERFPVQLGQFAANATKKVPILSIDRRAVLREIWVSLDQQGSDADGALLLDISNRDKSEGANDLLVDDFDCEAAALADAEAVQATLVAETSENERTLEAGDTLYAELISDSAAIDTNPFVTVTVILQYLEDVVG